MTRLAKLIRVESKLFLREPMAAFFALVFPAVLVLVLGARSRASASRPRTSAASARSTSTCRSCWPWPSRPSPW